MRAVVADGSGGPEILSVAELPDPTPGPGEVLVEVAAAGLNRADLLQRQGFYRAPHRQQAGLQYIEFVYFRD